MKWTPLPKHSTPQMKWTLMKGPVSPPSPPKRKWIPPRRKDYPQIEWIPLPKQYYTLFIIMTLIYRHMNQFMCDRKKGGFSDDRLSVHFRSRDYHCGSEALCSYVIIFYIISELLPVVAIFALIIISNLNFTLMA